MDEIIRQLIEARNDAKLSLQVIQERTKIPLRQLEYLESFQYDKIGPSVYIKGFIRRYAQEVGIDPDTLWEQESSRVTTTPRSARHRKRRIRFNVAPLLRIITIIALVIIVGFLIRTAFISLMEADPPAPPDLPPVEDPTPEDPTPEDPPTQEQEVVVEQIQADESEAIYVVHDAESLIVVLDFTSRCWTRITADGSTLREGTFESEQIELTDANILRFRFGAPKFVSVTVNGIEIEVPDVEKAFNLEIRLLEE